MNMHQNALVINKLHKDYKMSIQYVIKIIVLLKIYIENKYIYPINGNYNAHKIYVIWLLMYLMITYKIIQNYKQILIKIVKVLFLVVI